MAQIRNYQKGVYETKSLAKISQVTDATNTFLQFDGILTNAFSNLVLYADAGGASPLPLTSYESTTTDDTATALEAETSTGGSGYTVYSQFKVTDATYQNVDLWATFTNFGTYSDNDALYSVSILNAISYGTPLGRLTFESFYREPSAFDLDNPAEYWPAKCISSIQVYDDISETNWPALVPKLRNKALTYKAGLTGEKSAFNVVSYAIVSGVATLTFDSTDGEDAILDDLSEDNLVHDGYSNWRSVTLASAIGSIPAGDYAITDIDAVSRTIDFTCTESDASGSVTATVSFYENRVPNSSTTARLFEATGRTLVSANDGEGECISGLRRRDRGQGHWHNYNTGTGLLDVSSGVTGIQKDGSTSVKTNRVRDAVTDHTNGVPRTGLTTDPRSLIGHLYIWGQKYVA